MGRRDDGPCIFTSRINTLLLKLFKLKIDFSSKLLNLELHSIDYIPFALTIPLVSTLNITHPIDTCRQFTERFKQRLMTRQLLKAKSYIINQYQIYFPIDEE